jgi:hypothetical protein
MNHRFTIIIDIPEGVTWKETGRPLTSDQIEAIACGSLRERIIDQCNVPNLSWQGIGIVTESAPDQR